MRQLKGKGWKGGRMMRKKKRGSDEDEWKREGRKG